MQNQQYVADDELRGDRSRDFTVVGAINQAEESVSRPCLGMGNIEKDKTLVWAF